MAQQILFNARVGDTVTFNGVVTAVDEYYVYFNVPVNDDGGVKRWRANGSTIVEDVTPASPKYKLGTVLGGVGGPYVVIDEDRQRAVQVYDSALCHRGTIHNISDLDAPPQPVD